MSDTTELILEPEPAPKAPRSGGRIAAALVAVLAVVAGSVFAINALSGDENNPEDPVRAMFEAAEKSDVIGILEQLAPGERDALKEPLSDFVQELNRMEVLDGADPSQVSGIELTVDGLELKASKQSDDLAHVAITGGKGSYHVEFAKLPLGDFVLDLMGGPPSGSDSGSDSLRSEDDDDIVTTIRQDGRWYVSIGYSVAEAARRDAGKSLDDLGSGITPDGAESPEAAVREMVESFTTLDVRRMIALLSPDEMGALQDYAALYLPDLERGAQEGRELFDVNISALELDSDTSGDDAVVKIKRFAFEATFGEGGTLSFDGSCLTFQMPDLGFDDSMGEGGYESFSPFGPEEQRICPGDDPTKLFGMATGGFFGGADVAPPTFSFQDKTPDTGIALHRVDGEWYLSPVRTSLDTLVAFAELVQRSDLDAAVEWFERFQTAMEEGFTHYDEFDGSSEGGLSREQSLEGTTIYEDE